MKPACRILLLILIVIFAVVCTASLSDRKTYIIHMDNSKLLELKSANKQPHEWYEEILQVTSTTSADEGEEALVPELLYTYETTMTGFSAKLTSEQYQMLTDIDGVLHAAPDQVRSLQTTYSPDFLGLELGQTGLWNEKPASDVIIGVVDTGIWPEHISFSDTGLSPVPSRWKGTCEEGTNFSVTNCNKKLIGARYFHKGYEAAYGRIKSTLEFLSARDSRGHGTHTASTAAGTAVPGASFFGMAKGIARGMSFTSRIAAYKACWEGNCVDSDILAAIDQAVADGVDVLSLSLVGDATPYYQDSAIIAALGASQKGVFVAFSAGNSGSLPSTVGNVAPWVMTVAASSLDRGFLGQVKLSNGKTFRGASIYSGNHKKTKQLPLVYKETAGVEKTTEYCLPGSLSPSLVKGKIVLCMRGINDKTEKGFVVKSAGGAGMLLLNTPNYGEELVADPHVLPATLLGASSAKVIKEYLTQYRNLTAAISFHGTTYGARSPKVAAFSSRGPSPVDPHIIKPDITAPGMNILAAWPPMSSITRLSSDKRRSHFNILSGTSMSCPHVSGIAALIKSVHTDWSPAAIKSAIMTTAYTRDNRGHLISDLSASSNTKHATPFEFGSGHINPDKALDPGLVYDITGDDYLHYLCSINYTNTQVTILARRKYSCPSNKGKIAVQPGDLNYPSFAVIFDAAKKGKTTTYTYKRTVTNVGSGKISYKVFLDQPKGVKVSVEPKVLHFTKMGEKQSYKVSFTGTSSRNFCSFGSLIWVSGEYSVRSPIAITWQ
ncbi:subtilisin-like protease SBT1.1 [Chenopodium quinoa]|nr:subtilisin-like protease SBT1.1 [Chenopodium quinoa]XP_021748675.1 subtilisin-like protease SBT1.1 [Chenopodium quinoa]